MTRINDVAKTLSPILLAPHLTDEEHWEEYLQLAEALDADGHLAPDLPEPSGYNAGLPWWGACDTEVRPVGYEQRVICTDENGPWETSAADARALAYALLAAADYTERNA